MEIMLQNVPRLFQIFWYNMRQEKKKKIADGAS